MEYFLGRASNSSTPRQYNRNHDYTLHDNTRFYAEDISHALVVGRHHIIPDTFLRAPTCCWSGALGFSLGRPRSDDDDTPAHLLHIHNLHSYALDANTLRTGLLGAEY